MLRVLFAYRSIDVDAQGGAALVLRETRRALEAMGVATELTDQVEPETDGFDLVHAFNIWHPRTALPQLANLKAARLPVVWTPFYLNWCEYVFANEAVRILADAKLPEEERRRFERAFVEGSVAVGGARKWWPNEVYSGFHRDIARMLECVDHLCVMSYREIQALAQLLKLTRVSFTVTPHGVDGDRFEGACAERFREAVGDGDGVVLCVGSVDGRKNQLLLVEALRETDLKVVLIGPSYEPDYLELCMARGRGKVAYVGRAEQELVASAYKAVRLHALPSFAEAAALVNLEAAAAGCALVVSNRSSEFEYFGDAPYYCDPGDPDSIRAAVLGAHQNRERDEARWQALGEDVRERYTWERAARATLRAYARTLAEARGEEDRARELSELASEQTVGEGRCGF